ncbi:MAG: nicotinate-nucleotide adenylyltransferase [Gemmatimonadota bacterium]|nr:nicotinate-nucleotide adenylyltransferase [Gemmatimonadota bacterium]
MRRVGLLGGTFNPPHIAHLIVAQSVREALDLDRMVLIPTATHALKGEAEADPVDRARMAELAVAGDATMAVDRIEIDRGGTSYTVDTLAELGEREPDTTFYLVIGRDILGELDEWKDPERLPELAEVVVVTRGLEGEGGTAPELPFGGECTFVPVPRLEISSTEIRRRVAAGRSIRYWVPAGVESYVREHGLYERAYED